MKTSQRSITEFVLTCYHLKRQITICVLRNVTKFDKNANLLSAPSIQITGKGLRYGLRISTTELANCEEKKYVSFNHWKKLCEPDRWPKNNLTSLID